MRRNKRSGNVWEGGLDCSKILSLNKNHTEPTPHAAYPASSRHAIRPRTSAGPFPSVERSIRATESANAVAGGGGYADSLGRLLAARRAATGRPAKDRAALATAFIAKAILNLPTTRDLIGRLQVDEPLRRMCGWASRRAMPHESKFSRAFAEFAVTELPQQLHEAIVAATQGERLVGHIARDATAIPARGTNSGDRQAEGGQGVPEEGETQAARGQFPEGQGG